MINLKPQRSIEKIKIREKTSPEGKQDTENYK